MRTIDADKLAEIFADRMKIVKERYGFNSSEAGILSGAYKLLQSQPTIEPQRMRGRWIDKSEGRIEGAWPYCSVCDNISIQRYDFCPDCGADMRGKE